MTPFVVLFAACAALLIGPALLLASGNSVRVRALVDGLSVSLVGGLCSLVIIPHVVEQVGLFGFALVGAGLVIPVLLHRLHMRRHWPESVALGILALHALMDGAAIALGGEHIALAVVVHRLPVGVALINWALGLKRHGSAIRPVVGATAVLIAATVAGFAGSSGLHFGEASLMLEAVVAGVLLHVVLIHSPHHAHDHHSHDQEHDHHHSHHHDHEGHEHAHHHSRGHDQDHPHSHDLEHSGDHHHHAHDHHHHSDPVEARWGAIGALAGLAVVVAVSMAGEVFHVSELVYASLLALMILALESAPALILGFALAGVIPFLLTAARAASLGRGSRFAQSARGVLFGLPLPVCSCGVLPLYESLIRRGAPPAAALAFFVATPELGLDAILLSVPMLGVPLTVARVLAAVVVALLVGLLLRPTQTCKEELLEVTEQAGSGSVADRIRVGLRFGFVDVFDHTMPWIVFGLIIAALAEPLMSHGALENIPTFLQVPLAALVGIPVYVCASGATPIAALAAHKGLSAGAAIAFLIAGPATNVTTFGVLARLHGRRIAIMFGAIVAGLSILIGWIVDAAGVVPETVLETHGGLEPHVDVLSVVCLALLLLLLVASLFRQGPRGVLHQILDPIHDH